MDPQCKTAVVTLMDSGKDHPLATWLQIEKVLTAHGMAYKAKVSPEAMLVHPGNRASLCLNPFEVHAKGAKLMAIGLDPAMLGKSTCIEIATDADTRKQQFDFNKSDSKYLPVPGGNERFLSLSSSHTTAFLKAISAECLLLSQPWQTSMANCAQLAFLTSDQDVIFGVSAFLEVYSH